MKNSKLVRIFLFFFVVSFSITVSAQNTEKEVNRNDTTIVLKITGMATDAGLPLDGANISLYKENEEMEWEEITNNGKHDHNFSYNLFGNSYYTIRITKEGYYPRSLGINTVLPKKFLVEEIDVFEFDVDLIKVKPGESDFYYDFPIALLSYNPKAEEFEFNAKYTKHIKAKLGEEMKDPKAKEPKESKKPKK